MQTTRICPASDHKPHSSQPIPSISQKIQSGCVAVLANVKHAMGENGHIAHFKLACVCTITMPDPKFSHCRFVWQRFV